MVQDWHKVIWTDECAFNVGGFSGNTWVTRMAGEEYDEDCLLPKFRKLETIIAWGCISGNQKGPFVIWNKDEWGRTVNSHNYCQHILLPHLHPYWLRLCTEREDYVYLQQDNALPHRAKHTKQVLQNLNMFGYFLTWPPCSPDLNPIEHVWRLMKDRIYRRSSRPTTNPLLRIAIQEEWDAITDEEITNLTSSLPARTAAVRNVNGSHTMYQALLFFSLFFHDKMTWPSLCLQTEIPNGRHFYFFIPTTSGIWEVSRRIPFFIFSTLSLNVLRGTISWATLI